MIRKSVIFAIGFLFFIFSLPLGTKMIMELIHDQVMNSRYMITNLNEGYPPTPTTYDFYDSRIEMKETLLEGESYMDPWRNKTGFANLFIHINGEEVDQLEEYPVRLEEEGLNRYWGELAYLKVLDKKSNETEIYVMLKKTKEIIKEMPNGDIVGGAPDEEIRYTYYRLDEQGNISKESFLFPERDALQTKLLNAGYIYGHQIGYYTDAWHGYPNIIFPFIYPFITLIVGIILIIWSFPLRKRRKRY